MEGEPHPYFPRDLQLPGYVPVSLPQPTILAAYVLTSLLVGSVVWTVSGYSRKIAKVDRLLMCWWVFTGLSHLIFEGYVVFTPEFYKEKNEFPYLAEVWKEYCKGDSRFAARDATIITVAGSMAVLAGPASFLAVYAIATGKSYAHILQFAISVAQFYANTIYFITSYLEGDKFSASRYYYYAYFIAGNASWTFIPLVIATRCWKKLCEAVKVQSQRKVKSR